MIETALLYAKLGWAPFPISPNSKIPLKESSGYKDAQIDEPNIIRLFSKSSDCNIAIATGEKSKLIVIDVDNKNGINGNESLEKLQQENKRLPQTVCQRTPNGGHHLFFSLPPGLTIPCSASAIGPGLDIRGEGGYIVVAPSSIAGRRYHWEPGLSPFECQIAEAPDWLIRLPTAKKRNFRIDLSGDDKSIREGYRNDRLFEIGVVAKRNGLNTADTLSPYLTSVNELNCNPPLAKEEVQSIVKSVLSYNPENLFWDRYQSGKLKPTFRNGLNLIETNLSLQLFKYNRFTSRLEIVKEAPWGSPWNGVKNIDDDDLIQMKYFLKAFDYEPPINILSEVLRAYALNHPYHPVKDYLFSLSWDGIPRVRTFFSTYMEAVQSGYSEHLGELLFAAAVRRIMEPGCKFDYLIILEGCQGIKKSMALRVLSEPWFGEISLLERDKDTIEKMQGLWISEVAELEAFKKREVESLKSFLSTQVDRIRLPYAHESKNFPRQSVFVGTINPDGLGYLRDSTGNRRFLPIAVNKIDLEKIKADRDQLWAEGFVLYKNGFKNWIDEDIEQSAVEQQNARLCVDPWEEVIMEFLSSIGESKNRKIKIMDIWHQALCGSTDRMSRTEQLRISAILKKLGYKSKSVKINKDVVRYWVNITSSEQIE